MPTTPNDDAAQTERKTGFEVHAFSLQSNVGNCDLRPSDFRHDHVRKDAVVLQLIYAYFAQPARLDCRFYSVVVRRIQSRVKRHRHETRPRSSPPPTGATASQPSTVIRNAGTVPPPPIESRSGFPMAPTWIRPLSRKCCWRYWTSSTFRASTSGASSAGS